MRTFDLTIVRNGRVDVSKKGLTFVDVRDTFREHWSHQVQWYGSSLMSFISGCTITLRGTSVDVDLDGGGVAHINIVARGE